MNWQLVQCGNGEEDSGGSGCGRTAFPWAQWTFRGALAMVCHRGEKIPVARSPGPLNFVVLPNIRRCSAWNLLHITILASRSFKWLLDFWQMCAPLHQVFYYSFFKFCPPSYVETKKTGKLRITYHRDAFLQPLLQWISNKYYIFWICVCSLSYPACNARAPYCRLWPVSGCTTFFHVIS
jgi:hypothetical protein